MSVIVEEAGASDRIAEGYRSSDVGVIPEEWTVVPLSSLLDFRNGVNADKNAYGHGIRFINVLEVITKSHLRADDVPGRVSLSQDEIDAYLIHRGDVLFNRTSETQDEVGFAAVYEDDEPVVFGGFVIRGRPKTSSIDMKYLGYCLRAGAVREQIIKRGQGAIRANIGQGDLRHVLVPLPPPTEQRAIASALADTDRLLERLDRLIVKRRGVLDGAIDDLLSGRIQLPGFEDKRTVRAIGDIATIVMGGTPSTGVKAYWGGGIPWCTPTDITRDRGKYLEYTERTLTSEGLAASSAQLLPAGALLLCTRATIGAVKIAAFPVATNQGFKSLICAPDVSNEFFYYALLRLKEALIRRGVGSTFLEVSRPDVATIELRLPEKDEQVAIARVLSDVDDAIRALERYRQKVYALKQAMRQGLFSGRMRLTATESA
jgi:type I restriction enzyme, S subunit